nr:immunoglobulin heavy chain junction region [Macaca mulatta]MOX59662.1 immunoglobulin heavy chain junction region [Macaca mulatta]MOX60601.1 immunoglobulin heavy chain junction region [Macaca mulatta]MOX60868.1 immunoglobulin heavy chain junction region [Macaca mulatta]MOX61450.1 immunoglobulin heavy chain junction region [Macaca mulatta]
CARHGGFYSATDKSTFDNW